MRASIRSTISAIALATTTVAMIAPPAPAFAQKGDKKKQAKAYVDAGLAAQEAGDYDEAIELYKKAYELVPHPVLFFNIGQAHRLAGRDEEAQTSYEAYLEAEPKGAKAKEAQSFLKEIEARLVVKRRKEQEAARLAAEEQARRDAEAEALRKKQEEEALTRGTPERDPPEEETPVPDVEDDTGGGGGGGGWKRPTGIVVGSLGVVSLGVGVFFGLKAKSLSDELSGPGAVFDPGKVSDGEAAERNMFITVGAGAALVTTGIVLFVLGGGGGGESESSVGFTPVLGGDYDGLALSGRF
jgi:tetratricopeptide (TPR) repeat protein